MKSRNNLLTTLFVGAVLVISFLAGGCTTTGPAISSHADTGVDYAGYKSFMMLKPAGLAPARNPAITPALVRELREEATSAFTAKGMRKSPDGFADVLILVHGGLQDRLEVHDQGPAYTRFGRGFAAGQELDASTEGSLFVDVFDGRTRELIWRGSAVTEVNGMPTAEQIKATLDSIIARYPN